LLPPPSSGIFVNAIHVPIITGKIFGENYYVTRDDFCLFPHISGLITLFVVMSPDFDVSKRKKSPFLSEYSMADDLHARTSEQIDQKRIISDALKNNTIH